MGKKYIVVKGEKVYLDDVLLKDEDNDEEVVPETDPETDPDTEDVEKMAARIAEKIMGHVTKTKARDEDQDRKKKMAQIQDTDPGGSSYDPEVKIYTTKKGKAVSFKRSEMANLKGWFLSFLKKDTQKMFEYHQKLEPLVEGTNADGGFLVPTVLHDKILELLEDQVVVRPRATIVDMTGMKTNQLDISGIASKPRTSWTSENTAKSTSSMTFDQISLTPYKLTSIVTISTEIRDDSPFNVVQLVARAFADAIAKEEDKAFMTGNGSGRPTGIDNYTAGRTVNANNSLSMDVINAAYWRCPQPFRNNAVWIMNSRTIEAIANLKDSNNRPLLLESGILTEPGVPALKGRPVLEQNDLASSKIFFVDLKQYWIAVKQPMTIDTADQATVGSTNLWESNLIGIKVEERVDGELTETRAFVEVSNTGVS